MDELEEEFGITIFSPIETETIVLGQSTSYNTDEEQSFISYTDKIEVSYGSKEITVNEFEIGGFPWQED